MKQKEKNTKNETKKAREQQLQTARPGWIGHMIGVWGNPIGWFALGDRKRSDWTIINGEITGGLREITRQWSLGARTPIKEAQPT